MIHLVDQMKTVSKITITLTGHWVDMRPVATTVTKIIMQGKQHHPQSSLMQ